MPTIEANVLAQRINKVLNVALPLGDTEVFPSVKAQKDDAIGLIGDVLLELVQIRPELEPLVKETLHILHYD